MRTNTHEVQGILQDDKADVFLFIEIASDVVDNLLIGLGLSDTILRRIEAFLACHFYTFGNPELVREEYDKARFEYVRLKVGEGFQSTKWGQMALALDSTGTLKQANKGTVVMVVI